MTEWIPVSDRLPSPALEAVLCICEDKSQHVAIYCSDSENWYAGGWQACPYCGGRSKLRFEKKMIIQIVIVKS